MKEFLFEDHLALKNNSNLAINIKKDFALSNQTWIDREIRYHKWEWEQRHELRKWEQKVN